MWTFSVSAHPKWRALPTSFGPGATVNAMLAHDLGVETEPDEMIDHAFDVSVDRAAIRLDAALFTAGFGGILGIEARGLGQAHEHAGQGGEHRRFESE